MSRFLAGTSLFLLELPLLPSTCATTPPPKTTGIYAGGILGWGSTTWSDLVSIQIPVRYSSPIAAKDKGLVYGGFLGWQFATNFAIQVSGEIFPTTELTFDRYSYYAPILKMQTQTWVFSTDFKLLAPIYTTAFAAFATAGLGFVHRKDVMYNKSQASLHFGVGVDYSFLRHGFTEFGFQYYTGYDTPAADFARKYSPFLYTLELRLGFKF